MLSSNLVAGPRLATSERWGILLPTGFSVPNLNASAVPIKVNFEITFANRAPRRHPCQIVGRRGPAIVVGTFLQVAGSIPASRATSRAGRTVALRDFSMADQMSDYTSKPNVDPKAARRMSSREIADELRRALRQDIGNH
jgi:hypothetical protein